MRNTRHLSVWRGRFLTEENLKANWSGSQGTSFLNSKDSDILDLTLG